jgi:acyl-CoA thioester hydrolase
MRNDPHPHRRALAAYPSIRTLETRFTDMDVNRHLNNVAVSRLYEETRVRFNRELHASHPELGWPRYLVAHVAIDYLGEGLYPAPVVMGYGIEDIGRTSFRAKLAMFQNDACIGLCDTVMVHRGEAGPTPIPDALRTLLEGFALKG